MAEQRKKKKSPTVNKSAVKVNKARRKRVAGSSFADLAASQKIKPTKNAVELSGGFPGDENIDQFLDEIYKAWT
jgi:parvulin-like peptidyl-prolyl isomerase